MGKIALPAAKLKSAMPYLPGLIVAVAAYLLGSIPFGFLLVFALPQGRHSHQRQR